VSVNTTSAPSEFFRVRVRVRVRVSRAEPAGRLAAEDVTPMGRWGRCSIYRNPSGENTHGPDAYFRAIFDCKLNISMVLNDLGLDLDGDG